MSQEGNSELGSKFSTLNVNAMEFVPSFVSNVPATPTSNTPPVDSPATEEPASVEPVIQDASPTKTDEEQPISVAAPTESIDDKSPDNLGLCTFENLYDSFHFLTFKNATTTSNNNVYKFTCHHTDSIDGTMFVSRFYSFRFQAD